MLEVLLIYLARRRKHTACNVLLAKALNQLQNQMQQKSNNLKSYSKSLKGFAAVYKVCTLFCLSLCSSSPACPPPILAVAVLERSLKTSESQKDQLRHKIAGVPHTMVCVPLEQMCSGTYICEQAWKTRSDR